MSLCLSAALKQSSSLFKNHQNHQKYPNVKSIVCLHLCCCCSYLSCFFYAEKSLLMIAELPLPDTMFGQIFQMTNYLFGAFFMSIMLGQVVSVIILCFLHHIFFLSVFLFFFFLGDLVDLFLDVSFCSPFFLFLPFNLTVLYFLNLAARHPGNQTRKNWSNSTF